MKGGSFLRLAGALALVLVGGCNREAPNLAKSPAPVQVDRVVSLHSANRAPLFGVDCPVPAGEPVVQIGGLLYRACRRALDYPRAKGIADLQQPNPGRGAAPGQHVSHPDGPKRPGGELN
jgi:hypothetical protein